MASHLPKCMLCSYRQFPPDSPVAIYHRHRSAREVRSLQGAEYAAGNRSYLCPTCQTTHKAEMPYGLDVCVSTSTLHEHYQPREPGVICPPDSSHVDWLTIPGAKIEDLLLAWRLDYERSRMPMRVLLVAGLNDLAKGGDYDSITTEMKRFAHVVRHANNYHRGVANEVAVAPLLPAPKFVWYPDNGIPFIPYPKKIDICIFGRSRWIVGWGAPVHFQNPDIYFSKVTLDRWMGCTGAGPRVPH